MDNIGLDPALQTALEDPKNRMVLLRMEQTIISFLRSDDQPVINLPPMNSFYRLLAHKIAEYYSLTHYSNDHGSVTLEKSKYGETVAVESLADVTHAQQQTLEQAQPPKPKAKLLKNPSRTPPTTASPSSASPPASSYSSSSDLSNLDSTAATTAQQTTSNGPLGMGSFEARQTAYEQARARIFQNFTEQPNDNNATNTNPNQNQQQQQPLWDPEYVRYPSNS